LNGGLENIGDIDAADRSTAMDHLKYLDSAPSTSITLGTWRRQEDKIPRRNRTVSKELLKFITTALSA